MPKEIQIVRTWPQEGFAVLKVAAFRTVEEFEGSTGSNLRRTRVGGDLPFWNPRLGADGLIGPSAVSPDYLYPMGLVVIGLIFATTLRDFSGGRVGGGRVGLRGGGEGDLARSVDSPLGSVPKESQGQLSLHIGF